MRPEGAVAIDLEPELRGRFAEVAGGRTLVIEAFMTHGPGLPRGRMAVRLERYPAIGLVEVATIEGVPCLAERRLVPTLRAAGPTIRPVAGAVLGQLTIELARPLVWLDFLASPAARGR